MQSPSIMLKKLVAGRADPPLTDRGITQAIETGKFFQDMPSVHLLHSPLTRTTQTAYCIAKQLEGVVIKPCDDLIEMGAGVFTGKNIAEIKDKDINTYNRFMKYSWDGVDEAERIPSLLERSKSVWKQIADIANTRESNIVLVTHGGFLQWLFKVAFTIQEEQVAWSPIMPTSNCGIYQFHINPVINSQNKHEGVHASWKLLNYICYN